MTNTTLFSNHGHVLLFLSRHPDARLRDVADQVGITERAVQKIVRDLQDADLLNVTKRGRRNRYRINTRKALQQPLDVSRTVGNLLALFRDRPGSRDQGAATEPEPVTPAGSAARAPAAAEKPTPAERSAPPQPDKASAADVKPPAKKKRARRKKKKPVDDQQGSLF